MFSNETKIPDVSSIQLDTFLLSHIDERTIKNFIVLIGRTLIKQLQRHIQHEYSGGMARKSEVVTFFQIWACQINNHIK